MRHGIMAALVAVAALFSLNAASASDTPSVGPDSNLPVPRFVSLKTEGANGRRGPGLEHQVDWVYERVGLPLQVTGESGPWRRVVDPDGDQVWIHAQNLDQRRTAYVQEAVALRRNARESAPVLAYLAPGVVVGFTGCDGEWRRVTVGGRIGWVPANVVWGTDCAAPLG
ncbi:SH3 domain-containing protein [Vitreimonas sp.]|uniref:SH3 domain-containing protein n=1 Tax=Vitreimonas sp. TaxID=3069702 RepID=UPI002ED812B9